MSLLVEPTPPSLRRAQIASQARRSEAKAADRHLRYRYYKDLAPTEPFATVSYATDEQELVPTGR
jgi:hypothetical protein